MVTSRSSWKEPVPEHGVGVLPRSQPVTFELRVVMPIARIWPLRFGPGVSNRCPSLLVAGSYGCGPRLIVFVWLPEAGHWEKSGGRSPVTVSSRVAESTR